MLDLIKEETSSKLPYETGGILMGYWSNPFNEVIITHMTGPGPLAEHAPMYYKPDNKWQHEEAIKLYKQWDIDYLGDWHSHPYPSDRLSWSDMRTLRIISRHKQGRVLYPLMFILHDRNEWQVTVWKFVPTKLTRFLPIGNVETMDIMIPRE